MKFRNNLIKKFLNLLNFKNLLTNGKKKSKTI